VSLTGLTAAVLSEPVLAQAMADARGGVLPSLDLTGPAGVRPFVIAGLAEQGRTVLAVTPTTREAEDLEAALAVLLPPESVALFPSWETLPHERLSPRSDTVGRRLAVLRRVRHPDAAGPHGPLRVVVAPVRSVLQPQVPGLGDLEPVELAPGVEFVPQPGVARLGPACNPLQLVEVGVGEQGRAVGESMSESRRAEIIALAHEHGGFESRVARQGRCGSEQPPTLRQIAAFELFLEGDGVRRDNELPRLIDGLDDSGHEVSERLADAGAGFEKERFVGLHGCRDRPRHLLLLRTMFQAESALQPAVFGEYLRGEDGRMADGRGRGAGVVTKADHVSIGSANQWLRRRRRK
jgi:hypothetical protein